jgi:hypothetical protein
MIDIVQFSTLQLSTEKQIDREDLGKTLEQIARKSGVFEISVVDFNNEVIASTDPEKVGSHWRLPQDSVLVRMQTEKRDTLPDQVHYEVRIPLVQGRQVEGIVEMSVLFNDLRASLWSLSLRQMLIFLAVLAVAFLSFSAVLRRLHRPFGQLAARHVENCGRRTAEKSQASVACE